MIRKKLFENASENKLEITLQHLQVARGQGPYAPSSPVYPSNTF